MGKQQSKEVGDSSRPMTNASVQQLGEVLEQKVIERFVQLTDEQKAKLREDFAHFDSNHSGTIDLAEAKQLVHSWMKAQPLDEKQLDQEVAKVFADMDSNGDGQIDLDEFIHMYSRVRETVYEKYVVLRVVLSPSEEKALQAQFESMDVNRDGQITFAEAQTAITSRVPFGNTQDPAAQEQRRQQVQQLVQDMMSKYDHNMSGSISFEEFLQGATIIKRLVQ